MHAYENGGIVETTDGDDVVQRVAVRCGITYAQAAQAMQEYDEHFSSNVQMTTANVAEALRQRDLQWWYSIEKILALLIDYMSKQSDDAKLLRMAPKGMAFVLGFPLVAVGSLNGTKAELARVCGLQKVLGTKSDFTVGKCIARFMAQLKLAKIPGDRDEAAREKMRLAALKRNAMVKSVEKGKEKIIKKFNL